MFVISRNTAFTYRDKPIPARQIGRELGVRYVLEGSVRRSGNQVRVNVQLIDAAADAHLWAERFDRDLGDLFAVQNEITRAIAVALSAELVSAEAARVIEHLGLAGAARAFLSLVASDLQRDRVRPTGRRRCWWKPASESTRSKPVTCSCIRQRQQGS